MGTGSDAAEALLDFPGVEIFWGDVLGDWTGKALILSAGAVDPGAEADGVTDIANHEQRRVGICWPRLWASLVLRTPRCRWWGGSA